MERNETKETVYGKLTRVNVRSSSSSRAIVVVATTCPSYCQFSIDWKEKERSKEIERGVRESKKIKWK